MDKKHKGTLIFSLTYLLNNCVEIQPDGGPPERLIPRLIGGMPAQGGGPDKAVVQQLSRFKVGDRVKISWTYDGRKRLMGIVTAP